MFAWPDGWRRVAHVEPVTRCRPLAPVYAARPLDAIDYAAVYGGGFEGRHVCVDGHEMVTWHGEEPCWVCGGPGLRRN